MSRFAFLNGEPGYGSEIEESLAMKLTLEGHFTILVDDLFERPAKLKRILKYDTLVFGTTGVRSEEIMCLIYHFRSFVKVTGYAPKTVIFTMDEDVFIHLTEEFPNTKFYRLDYIDLSFIPLNYLNDDKGIQSI